MGHWNRKYVHKLAQTSRYLSEGLVAFYYAYITEIWQGNGWTLWRASSTVYCTYFTVLYDVPKNSAYFQFNWEGS
jgi:hypothetical protein